MRKRPKSMQMGLRIRNYVSMNIVKVSKLLPHNHFLISWNNKKHTKTKWRMNRISKIEKLIMLRQREVPSTL
jgi:hypothetical protein